MIFLLKFRAGFFSRDDYFEISVVEIADLATETNCNTKGQWIFDITDMEVDTTGKVVILLLLEKVFELYIYPNYNVCVFANM